MTVCNDFSEISVLIPGYSVEDIPTDLAESEAASLLNAIACAWHPRMLQRSSTIPVFRQAESLSGYPGRRIVLVPAPSESWMPHEWRSALTDQGHIVIAGHSSRDEWLTAIGLALEEEQTTEQTSPDSTETRSGMVAVPVLRDHFLALGTILLQTQLLSRRRHHFVDSDTILLGREVRLAAEASLAGDESTTRKHLATCFEHVRETRERFFPLNCFLIDICIPGDDEDPAAIRQLLASTANVNLFATGNDLSRWLGKDPSLGEVLKDAVSSGTLCLLTGHQSETRSSLGSMAATVADMERCRTLMSQCIGAPPRHWARRRFGLTASVPTLLNYFGFESAMHVALDDGLYPDQEHSQFDWQAPDGSIIAASSRIPLAVDSASGFLRFADRFNESMQDDTTAVLFLARLPTLKAPWLIDLQIAASYAPVLGEFATIDRLCHISDGSRRSERHSHSEYLSPFLIQSSVLKTEPPISGPASLRLLSQQLESLRNLIGIAGHIRAEFEPAAVISNLRAIEAKIADRELAQVDVIATNSGCRLDSADSALEISQHLDRAAASLAAALQSRVPGRACELRGQFIVNPIPFSRLIEIEWPQGWKRPAASNAIEMAERIENSERLLVKVPPGGFVWLTECETTKAAQPQFERIKGEMPLAEPLMLRNRHFEVALSDRTGGIASVARHGQRGNRLSQQVCFRFEREQSLTDGDSEETRKTFYAITRLIHHRILKAGAVFASVETVTELLSPVDHSVLATVRQTTSINRVQPRIHIELTIEKLAHDVKGNPWLTYYGCRFAWDNEAAAITRAVMGQAGGFRSERFESPDYVEISDPDHRAVIATHGRPYHRRSGPRMFDSLLIAEGESSRQFQFTIEFDQPFPLRTATDVITTPVILETNGIVPTSLASSWVLGLSARNVELVRTDFSPASAEQSERLMILLSETEGVSVQCVIRTARKPTAAFSENAEGAQKVSLEITDQGVVVPISAFQIRRIVLVL